MGGRLPHSVQLLFLRPLGERRGRQVVQNAVQHIAVLFLGELDCQRVVVFFVHSVLLSVLTGLLLELVSNAFDLEHRNIQDTFYANDKALVQMDTLRFGQLCLGILSLLVIQVLSIFVLVCTS